MPVSHGRHGIDTTPPEFFLHRAAAAPERCATLVTMETNSTQNPLDNLDVLTPPRRRISRFRLIALVLSGVLLCGAGTAFAIDKLADVAGEVEGY
jgi:hypothetical protein